MVPGSSLFLIDVRNLISLLTLPLFTIYHISKKTYFSLIIFITILCRYLFVLIYRITYNNNS
jgi:hypothetical protein